MPGGTSLIGLMHGDVQTCEANRVAGGREPTGVSELGQDRDRDQLPDPELPEPRLAAGLVAREGAQTNVHWSELDVERVDHCQRDGDLLARCTRQRCAASHVRPASVNSSPRCGQPW